MPVRERQRWEHLGGYRVANSNGATSTNYYPSLDEYTYDVVNQGDNQSFYGKKITRQGGLIWGQQSSPLVGYNWQGYPALYFSSDSYAYEHLTVPGHPTLGYLATEVLSRTNPSRASSQAVSNLLEMREVIPQIKEDLFNRTKRLVKDVTLKRWKILDTAAKTTIISYFGITPILSDLEVCLKFQELVDKRVREIERLRGKRGLRRTIDLCDGSTIATIPQAIIQSNGVTLRADIHKVTTVQIRGHVRWRPTTNWIESDSMVRSVAKRAIHGYYLDPSSLYEAMPWSWLLDYFINLGDLVKSTRNVFDAVHDQVKIITQTSTEVTTSKHTTSGSAPNIVSCTPFKCLHVLKRRQPATSTLSAQIGFLNKDQLSILGSLTYLKVR